MKEVVRYKANDGDEFNSKNACLKHEEKLRVIKKLNKILCKKPVDKDCSFANGSGYIQHTVQNFISESCKALKVYEGKDPAKRWKENPRGWVGRYLCDGGSEFAALWSRISCIDPLNREWGQPYYVLHPNEAKQIQLNK